MVLRSENALPSNGCCIHSVGTQETSVRVYYTCLDLGAILYFVEVDGFISSLYNCIQDEM